MGLTNIVDIDRTIIKEEYWHKYEKTRLIAKRWGGMLDLAFKTKGNTFSYSVADGAGFGVYDHSMRIGYALEGEKLKYVFAVNHETNNPVYKTIEEWLDVFINNTESLSEEESQYLLSIVQEIYGKYCTVEYNDSGKVVHVNLNTL